VLVDVEQVVRPTVAHCHDDLTDRDPRAGDEVQALPVLHHPAGIVELPSIRTRARLLGRELALLAHDSAPLKPPSDNVTEVERHVQAVREEEAVHE